MEEDKKKSVPVGVGYGMPWMDQWHFGAFFRYHMQVQGCNAFGLARASHQICHAIPQGTDDLS